MTAPQRIQRKRTKGWRMPENTVYVGRGSRWGNPYPLDTTVVVEPLIGPTPEDGARVLRIDRELSIAMFRSHIVGTFGLDEIQAALRGKNLACWCALDKPCHADVLLELANQED